jgi:cell division protein ZapA (FtsZ GTPase activity inhibitor)
MIFRCMNLPPSARQVTNLQRLAAHLDSTIRRLHSYFQYIGLVNCSKVITMLQTMRDINLERP